jgi:hypothetical protein
MFFFMRRGQLLEKNVYRVCVAERAVKCEPFSLLTGKSTGIHASQQREYCGKS